MPLNNRMIGCAWNRWTLKRVGGNDRDRMIQWGDALYSGWYSALQCGDSIYSGWYSGVMRYTVVDTVGAVTAWLLVSATHWDCQCHEWGAHNLTKLHTQLHTIAHNHTQSHSFAHNCTQAHTISHTQACTFANISTHEHKIINIRTKLATLADLQNSHFF